MYKYELEEKHVMLVYIYVCAGFGVNAWWGYVTMRACAPVM